MKNKNLLKITSALLCLVLLVFAVASCGKDNTEETNAPTEAPTNEATEPVTPGVDIGSVEDNDAAEDIGAEVVLPPVKF